MTEVAKRVVEEKSAMEMATTLPSQLAGLSTRLRSWAEADKSASVELDVESIRRECLLCCRVNDIVAACKASSDPGAASHVQELGDKLSELRGLLEDKFQAPAEFGMILQMLWSADNDDLALGSDAETTHVLIRVMLGGSRFQTVLENTKMRNVNLLIND